MKFPYDYLAIPENCLLEKRIYKKLFYENSNFTTTDKKWFTKDIDHIRWQYTIKPELTMIKSYEGELFTYHEIVVMEVDVNQFNHLDRLSDLIHRSIPYPLFIIFRQGDSACLSVASKRYNLSDAHSATLNKLWVTAPLAEDTLQETEQQFLEQLEYEKQPQLHLKAFYQAWLDSFQAYRISRVTGRFEVLSDREKNDKRLKALSDYRKLEDNIAKLRNQLSKESAFSKKMELNVEIKELQDQLNDLSEQL